VSETTAVTKDVARMYLRNLQGFKGYPPAGPGEDYFVKCLTECALSVSHLVRILDSFDDKFPTLRELRDAAHNTRPPEPDPRQQWKKECGPPNPNVVNEFLGPLMESTDPTKQHWQQDAEMWRKLKIHFKVTEFSQVSWSKIYAAMKELGYSLTPEQTEILRKSA